MSPAGNSPADTVQLYGLIPPSAARVAVYAVPAVPAARFFVLIVSGAATAMTRSFTALAPAASADFAVKLKVPVFVGVPLIVPLLEFKLNPSGSEPVSTVHEKGPVPPLRANVEL